jgi:hypothetical protein
MGGDNPTTTPPKRKAKTPPGKSPAQEYTNTPAQGVHDTQGITANDVAQWWVNQVNDLRKVNDLPALTGVNWGRLVGRFKAMMASGVSPQDIETIGGKFCENWPDIQRILAWMNLTPDEYVLFNAKVWTTVRDYVPQASLETQELCSAMAGYTCVHDSTPSPAPVLGGEEIPAF